MDGWEALVAAAVLILSTMCLALTIVIVIWLCSLFFRSAEIARFGDVLKGAYILGIALTFTILGFRLSGILDQIVSGG